MGRRRPATSHPKAFWANQTRLGPDLKTSKSSATALLETRGRQGVCEPETQISIGGSTMRRQCAIAFAIVLVFLWVLPASAQCDKDVNDNGVIQKTLEEYFGTAQVSGKPDAGVDWCYYSSRDQLFFFSTLPCDSDARAMAMLDEIGLAILKKCRAHQKLSRPLSPFEENVLNRGFSVSMMRTRGSGPLATYISPSSVP